MNNNDVPIRMILLNNFPQYFGNEDSGTVSNAAIDDDTDQVDGTYEFVGSDSDSNDRNLRSPFSFNYFRLGETASAELAFAPVQRRIAIVNGSTSELLFSLTPIGTGPEVTDDILSQSQTIINAINSVELVPEIPEDLSIVINELEVESSNITIQFESAEDLTGFSILASTTLEGDFSIDLTENATITQSSSGVYEAIITSPNEEEFPNSLFLRVEF